MKDRNNQGIRDQPRKFPKRRRRPDPCWMSPVRRKSQGYLFLDPYNAIFPQKKSQSHPSHEKPFCVGEEKKKDSVQFGLKRKSDVKIQG